MPSNNWYVLTGGPSSGKTTLIDELQKRGYKTVPEAARTIIDKARAKGISLEELRADEKIFQYDVARLKAQIEASKSPTALTFFDRGMHDTMAYLNHYGFDMEDWIVKLHQQANYKQVFLLEPLPNYVKDYARTEDDAFARDIHRLLHEAYAEYGMKPQLVPAVGIEERISFILDHIKQEGAV